MEITSIYQQLLIVVISFIFYHILCIVIPPPNFPKNIPTIPFYISFLGSYTSLDQGEIYEKYLRQKLEQYGAVKIYFASRWNILVTRNEYLLEIFKNEDIYAKSGNQEKIPHSVLGKYTGDNIISAHGKNWKTYRKILAPSIQFPDLKHLQENTNELIKNILLQVSSNGKSINVGSILQKYCLQNIGQSILGVDFGLLSGEESELHSKITYLKSQIFRPFYLNFPSFDNFPIPSRVRAKREVSNFKTYYWGLLQRQRNQSSSNATNSLIQAFESGNIAEKQYMDNAIILMVAGHENPLLLMLSLFFVLSKNPQIQEAIRADLELSDSSRSPILLATIYETLRLFPPLGQIINRKTTQVVFLGGKIKVPKGVYVGYNNYGAGRDKGVWGKNADQFDPYRWGTTLKEVSDKYLAAKRTASLPAFHGGRRACLGEKYAITQIKLLISEVITNFKLSADPRWEEKLTPAGPVCPFMLSVNFEPLQG